MALFNPAADIPAVIDTWEKLVIFACLGLESVCRDKEVVIRTQGGGTESRRILELADFLDDGNIRRISILAYIPIEPNADVSAGKLFTKALPISGATVGADYRTA